jgi:hypothetical protein
MSELSVKKRLYLRCQIARPQHFDCTQRWKERPKSSLPCVSIQVFLDQSWILRNLLLFSAHLTQQLIFPIIHNLHFSPIVTTLWRGCEEAFTVRPHSDMYLWMM